MQRIENDCCNCANETYPCLGHTCPRRHVLHVYCDKCDEEIGEDEIYVVDGEELCEDCLKNKFRVKWDDLIK